MATGYVRSFFTNTACGFGIYVTKEQQQVITALIAIHTMILELSSSKYMGGLYYEQRDKL